MAKKKIVMDAEAIDRSLTRITYEILERNKGTKDLVVIGIRRGGEFLARRIRTKIQTIEGTEIPIGILDITLYRDDFMTNKDQPAPGRTEIPFSLDQKKVILVDDVIFTGRTIRAAMDALIDFGRPTLIQLAVLIDRGHRELPISADFIGESLPSALWDDIDVSLKEHGERDEVLIIEG